MKWTYVDSHGLGAVHKTQANGRAFQALQKLHNGSFGSTRSSIWHADRHTPGFSLLSELLKAPFGGPAKWL